MLAVAARIDCGQISWTGFEFSSVDGAVSFILASLLPEWGCRFIVFFVVVTMLLLGQANLLSIARIYDLSLWGLLLILLGLHSLDS